MTPAQAARPAPAFVPPFPACAGRVRGRFARQGAMRTLVAIMQQTLIVIHGNSGA